MSASLGEIVDRFAALHVVVIGEAMLDSYLEGESSRLSAEAPVPVVSVAGRRDVPGGAANTAANVRSLGGRVTLLSVVGDDPEGQALRSELERQGVSTGGVLVDRDRRTLAKHRVISSSQMLLRFDQGSSEGLSPEVEDELIERLAEATAVCDAVVVSDYGYGILTPRVVRALRELQGLAPRIVVVDSKDVTAFRNVGVTAVKPNYRQAIELLGEPAGDAERADLVAARGERILELTGAQIAAVTLDTEGAVVIERGRPVYRTYARPTANSRAMGAGDTFASALALALAAGAHTPAAAELASAAAEVVVGKDGTACCSTEELRAHVSGESKYARSASRLEASLALHREQGKRIVFTNGCFDILHRGHITYLSRAKTLGDVLVVGLNSDESVGRLKGPGRPINTLEDRAEVLAALSCVDHIVPFDEDTPVALIEAVRPDVFVKGGDYTREMLPEAPVVEALGGSVHLLPYVEDRSTTGIIERIREAAATSAAKS